MKRWALPAAALALCGCPAQSGDDSGTFGVPAATSDGDSGGTTSSGGGVTGLPSSTGAASTGEDPSTSAPGDSASDGHIFDVGGGFDLGEMMCIDCELFAASQQSGTFNVMGGDVFATAELKGDIVYTIGEYGTGRFVTTADSSLPYNEQTDCPLHDWLAGGVANPNRLLFGWTPSDGPLNVPVPLTQVGVHMPVRYIGNPALLAADYDVVMYFEASGQYDGGDQPSNEEIQTLLD